ncbi:MAG TPA: polysaccharide deacetylase family protein [Bryobacteraceae bacterium]|nr:polysaccharide deacetylase family protein [Bryobacteraceae bacterium]
MKRTRREFAFSMTAAALSATTPAPRVAITMDDFRWRGIPGDDPKKANRALLDALAKHSNLKAALFVCGMYVDQPAGRQLLQPWSDAGHIIGNHTYSHPSYNSPKVTAASFGEDLLHAEEILKGFPSFQKILRFPFLKEGDTAAKRDAMRAFLAAHSYHTGHVTIDTSDWYFDQRLHARLEKDPAFDTRRYREPYLEHILDRATYYDTPGARRPEQNHPAHHPGPLHAAQCHLPGRPANNVREERLAVSLRGDSLQRRSVQTPAEHRPSRRKPDLGTGKRIRPLQRSPPLPRRKRRIRKSQARPPRPVISRRSARTLACRAETHLGARLTARDVTAQLGG